MRFHPRRCRRWVVEVLESYTAAIAQRLDVRGLINVQFAVAGTTVYVIEANPRASRTVPFVAKATGRAARQGGDAGDARRDPRRTPRRGFCSRETGRYAAHVAVKEAVLPFNRFPEVDPALGPEMRSTGEVMGIDDTFGRAFYKAELAAGNGLADGAARCSCRSPTRTSQRVWWSHSGCGRSGLGLAATAGTAEYLAQFDLPVDQWWQGARRSQRRGSDRPTAPDLIADGKIGFVVNTPRGSVGRSDGEHDPQGGQPASRELCDHGELRPWQRRRAGRAHGRCSPSEPAGVPLPRAGTRHAVEPRVVMRDRRRVGRLRGPGDDGVGNGGVRRRARAVHGPRVDRRGRHQVDRAVRVGREPGAAGAPDAAGHDERRRAAGPGIEYWLATVCPRCWRPGRRSCADLGSVGRRLPPRAEMLADAPPAVVAVEVNLSCPNLEGRGSIFAHDAELSAEVIEATAACGRPRWAKLSANTDRIVEVAERCRRPAPKRSRASTRCSGWLRPATRCARRSEPAAVGCPVGRSTRWPCAPFTTSHAPARAADRRRRRSRVGLGRRRDAAGRSAGGAGRNGDVRRPRLRRMRMQTGAGRVGAETRADRRIAE